MSSLKFLSHSFYACSFCTSSIIPTALRVVRLALWTGLMSFAALGMLFSYLPKFKSNCLVIAIDSRVHALKSPAVTLGHRPFGSWIRLFNMPSISDKVRLGAAYQRYTHTPLIFNHTIPLADWLMEHCTACRPQAHIAALRVGSMAHLQ